MQRKNAMLMEFSAYKRFETEVLNDIPFNEDGGITSIYSEDKKSKTRFSLYMPSIAVLEGYVRHSLISKIIDWFMLEHSSALIPFQNQKNS